MMNLSKKLRSQKGVSLIEILLVVVIIGFIALLTTSLPSSIGLIGVSDKTSLANDIAAKQIEYLRHQTFINLANGSNSFTDLRLSNLPSGGGTYLIEDCPVSVCASDEEIKKATVTVTWSDKGVTRSVKITTFISEGGLQ